MPSTRLSTGALKPTAPAEGPDEDSDCESVGESDRELDPDFKRPKAHGLEDKAGYRYRDDVNDRYRFCSWRLRRTPTLPTCLRGLLDVLPDELIRKVLLQLDAPDLFAIARASKAAYSLVMDEASGVWQALEGRLVRQGMPQRPEELSIPQYLALWFSSASGCTNCGSRDSWPGARTAWQYYKSYCWQCRKTDFVYEWPTWRQPPKTLAHLELKRAYPDLDGRVALIVHCGPKLNPWGHLSRVEKCYLRSEIDEALTLLAELDRVPADEAQSILADKAASISASAIKAKTMSQSDWLGDMNRQRASADTQEAQVQRDLFDQEVRRRLEEAGLASDLYDRWKTFYHYTDCSFFGRSHGPKCMVLSNLTPDNWTKLETALLQYQDKLGRDEASQDRAGLVRLASSFLPALHKLRADPSDERLYHVHVDLLVDIFTADELKSDPTPDHLSRVGKWFDQFCTAMASALRRPDDTGLADADVLGQTDALVICKQCRDTTFWPRAIDHRCLVKDDRTVDLADAKLAAETFEPADSTERAIAETIADTLGFDIDTTAPGQLEGRGEVFVLGPDPRSRRRPAQRPVSFLAMVRKLAADPDGAAAARRVEMGWTVERRKSDPRDRALPKGTTHIYFCTRCERFAPWTGEDEVWEHLLRAHGEVALPDDPQRPILTFGLPLSTPDDD